MQELKYYITALYYSLFSRKFYADLIGRRNALGVKYLLVLAIIVAAPISIEIKYLITKAFPSSDSESAEDNWSYIKSQVPEIYIQNNNIKIDAVTNQNIISRSGDLVAVFDVENKIDDLTQYNKILVINSDSIRLKLPENQGTAVILTNEIAHSMKQYFIESAKGDKLDTQRFFDDLWQITKTPLPLIIFFTVIWYFIKYLFSVFAYSFMAGMFLTMICKKTSFDFRQCFRIAVFTATPVALIEAISNVSGGGLFSYTSLVYFITHMLYIHFAVESYKKLG